MLNNLLQVSLKEFKDATKIFQRKRMQLGPVLLAYESEFLSIESGGVAAVMHATGEWHGRAIFSPDILRALVMVPPLHDPIKISYDDGHLHLGSMNIICQWYSVSQAFIEDLTNPGFIDLLALGISMPRAEIRGSALGKQIRLVYEKVERRIMNAAKQLQDLEITEAEIRLLVEERVKSRLGTTTESTPDVKKIKALFDYLEERIKAKRFEHQHLDSSNIRIRDILKTEIAELEAVRVEFERLFLS